MLNQNIENIELWDKLSRFWHLLHRRRFFCRSGDPMSDTTRGQGRILAFLKLQDNIRTKDLAYLLDMRISSLNELLSKLEKSGYLVREPSETDKRVMLIRLTDQGRTAKPSADTTDQLLNCLTAEEQATFSSYLDRLIAALENEQAETNSEHYEEHCRRREEAMERFRNRTDTADGRHGHGGGPGARRKRCDSPFW